MGETDKDNTATANESAKKGEKSELEDFLYGWEYFSMKDVVPKYIEKLFKAFRGEDKGCLNPFSEKIFGFNNGDLVVICSKQSMLRTQFVLKWVREFALRQQKSVGLISCGFLDYDDIALRLFSPEANRNYYNLRTDHLRNKEIEKLQVASGNLCDTAIYISHLPNTDFEKLEIIARAMVESHKIEILFVDGFEYMYEIVVSKLAVEGQDTAFSPDDKRGYYNEIDSVIKQFKTFAEELDIPIVLTMPVKKDTYIAEVFEDRLVIPLVADKVLLLHKCSGSDSEGNEIVTVQSRNMDAVDVKYSLITKDFKLIEDE